MVTLCSCDLFDDTTSEAVEVKFQLLPSTSKVVVDDFQFSVADITLGFNSQYDFSIEHTDSIFVFDLQIDSSLFIENGLIEARNYKFMTLNMKETLDQPIEPMGQDNSVFVSGIYLGNSFNIVFEHDTSVTLSFGKPIDLRDLGDSLASLNIYINTDSWFYSRKNKILDPTDRANHSQIKANILNSFSLGKLSDCKNPKNCDDTVTQLPEIIIADTLTSESSETMDFRIELSSTSLDTVVVYYETLSRSAKSGEDFVFQSDSIIFIPQKKRTFISIPIINDSKKESDESFALTLLSSKNAIISNSNTTVTGKIINDDN